MNRYNADGKSQEFSLKRAQIIKLDKFQKL